ncbi:MAG TPA: alpha/beta hydrolase [Candidatus Binatia bacterium]
MGARAPKGQGAMSASNEPCAQRLSARQLHGQLAMPTFFIWGANDQIFPEPKAREMITQFPQVAGFHSIAKAKLFFYEEHPQEVARLIEHFLQ